MNREVLVNDDYKGDVNGEEEAYEVIEKELGITPLRLGYMPSDMVFYDFELWDGYAKIKFLYKNEIVYFIQSKQEKATSLKTDSNGENINTVYNRWLNQNIKLDKEDKTGSLERYAASFVFQGAWYRIVGSMEEGEFLEIIKRIMP